ncbi:MAG: SAM-dependent methyltransferase [Gammaproteobacteria bacterium]|jgi:ribosomal protein L11 methylase PrmA|nr:SAM-dependent methyltransferase [Gammaproteobacteria bacterium]MBT3870323.1 SAM-dependent methyltransferase [Gammaproteobacteria bacterium]MBT4381030.1 SAM-dependent methyltransferase [Gammaproteobacteria bacterium]MBT4619370.1 SAM-dependent methyltransferase [Gammaproteobacteria bacterium]MBT5200084.1 SAM-dependent methyltransferase [Gammaproteobacteria bacterium]
MKNLSASFRDPSGHLFWQDGELYRSVEPSYAAEYDLLMSSGLYDALIEKGLMVRHDEVGIGIESYRTLKPELVPYISYPYEWSFNQLKDAALLTLQVNREALKYGMSLKDASAYNVQFLRGKPVFIDTLSFETYVEGNPWIAYKQFCQHFLAPVALSARRDFRLTHLLKAYIDGIPLDLASSLLPRLSWLSYSLLAHIHLHAMSQRRYEDVGRAGDGPRKVLIGRLQYEGLIGSLERAVSSLSWKYASTEWGSYYDDTNYDDEAMLKKTELVTRFLEASRSDQPQVAADFGANTGRFSRLASDLGYLTLAFDIDEVAVDKNYQQVKTANEENLLPLILDLSNPSPGLGWMHQERDSFVDRQEIDVGVALAIIHHLAISNNVPLASIGEFFARCCRRLIIEFVPKADSQVRRLLATREDIFNNYDEEGFEAAFGQYFTIVTAEKVTGSERTLYLLERN